MLAPFSQRDLNQGSERSQVTRFLQTWQGVNIENHNNDTNSYHSLRLCYAPGNNSLKILKFPQSY